MTQQSLIRPPLGLPPGSVRALLSLLTVSAVIAETIRGHELPPLLSEALMIVLAVYFAARRSVSLPPATLAHLEKEGIIKTERYPLFLPKFSIRVIMLLSFLGAAAYLYQQGSLFTNPALSSLGLVFAYLLGVLFRRCGETLRNREAPSAVINAFSDLRAVIVLGAVATLTTFYWFDTPEKLPEWAQRLALTLLLYYFGAR